MAKGAYKYAGFSVQNCRPGYAGDSGTGCQQDQKDADRNRNIQKGSQQDQGDDREDGEGAQNEGKRHLFSAFLILLEQAE